MKAKCLAEATGRMELSLPRWNQCWMSVEGRVGSTGEEEFSLDHVNLKCLVDLQVVCPTVSWLYKSGTEDQAWFGDRNLAQLAKLA